MEVFLCDFLVPFCHSILGFWVAGKSFWFIDSEPKQTSSFLFDKEKFRHHTGILDFELEPGSGWDFGLLGETGVGWGWQTEYVVPRRADQDRLFYWSPMPQPLEVSLGQ